VLIDYDQAKTGDWSHIDYTYGSQGALVSTLVHWDDGTDSFSTGPATASTASGGSSRQIQLVQAMAGFGGGNGAVLNAAPVSADTSQQSFLTTPHA
jgi:hypothetical protein